MSKVKDATGRVRIESKVSRPGVHSKNKNSKSKTSKNYRKLNRGQGR
jgi:hypothetical protein